MVTAPRRSTVPAGADKRPRRVPPEHFAIDETNATVGCTAILLMCEQRIDVASLPLACGPGTGHYLVAGVPHVGEKAPAVCCCDPSMRKPFIAALPSASTLSRAL
jgi:hypothetical protein